MIFLSLAGAFAVQWQLFRGRPLYDACWTIFIIFIYYAYFVPVWMSLSGEYSILLVSHPIYVNESDMALVALVNFLGFLGLAGGYWALTRDALAEPIERRSTIELISQFASLRVMFATIVVLFLSLVTIFYRDLFAVFQGYTQKIETNYDSSGFAFVMGIALLFSSIAVNYLSLLSKGGWIYAVTGLIGFTIVSFLVFSKQPFFFAYLAVVCYLSRRRNISPFLLTLGLVVGATVVLVYLVPVFAAYRGTGTIDFGLDYASSVTLSTDALGPFGVVIYSFGGYVNVDNHPFLQSFFLWIPRFLWPDRPLDLPEDFAREIIIGWRPGLGVAFSPLAEAYVRMGIAGVPIFMAACGAAIAAFQRFAAWSTPAEARHAVSVTVGSALALTALRGAFSLIITHGMQLVLPIVLVGLAAHQLQRALSRRQRAVASG